MPIPFNPKSVINFISSLSPIFITTFLVLDGAFNGTIKFLFYLIGLFIAILLGIMMRGSGNIPYQGSTDLQRGENYENFVDKCLTFDGPFNVSYAMRNGPSSHAVFHAFTIMYFAQSIINNPYDIGWGFLFLLIVIATLDLTIRKKNNCNTFSNFIKGGVLGVGVGLAWWQIIANSSWPGPGTLYYGKEDTMKKCKLGKTKFRCKPKKIE